MIMPLSDDDERPVGLCVADLPSSIRHSCRPNAYVAFPEGLTLSGPLRVVSLIERCATEDKEEEVGGIESDTELRFRSPYPTLISWFPVINGMPF